MAFTDLMRRAFQAARLFFEFGTLRKIPRMHAQVLGIHDPSDTIAAHTSRTAMIGWVIAQEEGLDAYRVVMMCLLHDIGETRSGDQNWIHKRYVKVHSDEIRQEQLGSLPWPELKKLADEYEQRTTPESKAVKDADELEQLLLIREYAHAGSREAERWLQGSERKSRRLRRLHLDSSKALGEAIYETAPYQWWNKIWTNQNR